MFILKMNTSKKWRMLGNRPYRRSVRSLSHFALRKYSVFTKQQNSNIHFDSDLNNLKLFQIVDFIFFIFRFSLMLLYAIITFRTTRDGRKLKISNKIQSNLMLLNDKNELKICYLKSIRPSSNKWL